MALKFEVVDFTQAIKDSNTLIKNLENVASTLEEVDKRGDKAILGLSGDITKARAEVEALAKSSKELQTILAAGNVTLTKNAALQGDLGEGAQKASVEIERAKAAYSLLAKELVGRETDAKRLANQLDFLNTKEGEAAIVMRKQIADRIKQIKDQNLSEEQLKRQQDQRVKSAMDLADQQFRNSQKIRDRNLKAQQDHNAKIISEAKKFAQEYARNNPTNVLDRAISYRDASSSAISSQIKSQMEHRYRTQDRLSSQTESAIAAGKASPIANFNKSFTYEEGRLAMMNRLRAQSEKAIASGKASPLNNKEFATAELLAQQKAKEDALVKIAMEGADERYRLNQKIRARNIKAQEAHNDKVIAEARKFVREYDKVNSATVLDSAFKIRQQAATEFSNQLKAQMEQRVKMEEQLKRQSEKAIASGKASGLNGKESELRKAEWEKTKQQMEREVNEREALHKRLEAVNKKLNSQTEKAIASGKAMPIGAASAAKREMSATGLKSAHGFEVLSPAQARANAEFEKAKRRVDAVNRATMEFARANVNAKGTIDLLAIAVAKATGNTRNYTRSVRLASQATAGMRAGLNAAGSHMGIFTSSTIVTAAAVYGLVTALRETISVGSEFTGQMARSLAVMNTNQDQTASMTNQVRQLAQDTVFTATEVSQGLLYLGMAGLSTTEASQALHPALKLASIGMIDMSRAADISTNIMTAFGIGAADFTHIVDDMATAVTSSNMDIEQLGNSLSYVGPIAHEAGLSLEETIASMEVLHNNGIKASRAGTAMRKSLLSLMSPSQKAADILTKYNIGITDSEGRMRPYLEIMRSLNVAMEEQGLTASEVSDIVGVRATAGFLKLIEAANGGKDSLESFHDALVDNEGAADRLQRRIEDFLGADFQKLVAALQEKALQLYDRWEHTLRGWTQGATDWIKSLDPDKIYAFTRSIADMGKELAKMLGLLIKIGVTIKGATFGARIGSMFHPIAGLVGGVVGGAAGWFGAEYMMSEFEGLAGIAGQAGKRYIPDERSATGSGIAKRKAHIAEYDGKIGRTEEAIQRFRHNKKLMISSKYTEDQYNADLKKMEDELKLYRAQSTALKEKLKYQERAYKYINDGDYRHQYNQNVNPDGTGTGKSGLGKKENAQVGESIAKIKEQVAENKRKAFQSLTKAQALAEITAEIAKREGVLNTTDDGNLAAAQLDPLTKLYKKQVSARKAYDSETKSLVNKAVKPYESETKKYKNVTTKWENKSAQEEEERFMSNQYKWYDKKLHKAELEKKVIQDKLRLNKLQQLETKKSLDALKGESFEVRQQRTELQAKLEAQKELGVAIEDSVQALERYAEQRRNISDLEKYLPQTAQTLKDMKDIYKNLDQAASRWINGMADSLHQFVMTGKLSFSDLANSIISDMARIASQKAAAGIFEFISSTVLSSFGPGSSLTGSAATSQSLGSSSAGYSSKYMDGFFGARASGGSFISGNRYLVGENGPEILNASPSGAHRITPNHELSTIGGGAGDTNISVTVNIDEKGGSSENKEGQGNQLGTKLAYQVKAIVKQTLVDEQRAGGIMAGGTR